MDKRTEVIPVEGGYVTQTWWVDGSTVHVSLIGSGANQPPSRDRIEISGTYEA